MKSQILNVIEYAYTNQFNEGLMDYLKNGGQLQQIQGIINNQLCVFLNQSVDNQNSTLVQALQSNNSDVRYQAYLTLQNMSGSIDAKLRPQLEAYVFNLMEFEADLHVLKMQLRFLSMSQEPLQITSDEPLVSVWKRIVIQQNNQVYELCGLLQQVVGKKIPARSATVERVLGQVETQLKLKDVQEPDDMARLLEKCGEFSPFPFESAAEMIQASTQQFHKKSYLVAYCLHFVSWFDADQSKAKFMNEAMQEPLLKQYYILRSLQCDDEEQLVGMLQQMQQTEDLQQFIGEFAKHNKLADIIRLAARMCSAQNAGVFGKAIADKVGADTDKGLIVLAISLLY